MWTPNELEIAENAVEAADPAPFTRQQQEAAAIAFLTELEGFRAQMESLLDQLPLDDGNARRLITRELAITPREDQLDTIVRIAADRDSKGPRHDLPRQLLLLRIIAEREISSIWWSNRLEADDLRHSAEVAPQLLIQLQEVERQFREVLASMEGLTLEDRDFLLQVADSLMIEKEPLVAAQLMGPRLEMLAEAAARGEILEAAPALSADEAALFPLALDASCGDMPPRVCLDALALKSLIAEDLENWRGQAPDTSPTQKRRLLDRMKMEHSAYQIVSERLQQQHDAALIARLPDFAAELRAVRASLYAEYLHLKDVLDCPDGPDRFADYDPVPESGLIAGYQAVEAETGAASFWVRHRLPVQIGLALVIGLALGTLL